MFIRRQYSEIYKTVNTLSPTQANFVISHFNINIIKRYSYQTMLKKSPCSFGHLQYE